ncbi:transposase [Gluconacetobacter sacchari DSM 12717]|uniref:Transposase n=1 Tax=Gluconacetobacter sacchari DSM 12717 TaxID=1307940 RepID=A0ABQ0P1W4_9PROT|nr:transposase [Gluconacetobacter sacchari DSM 12717]
MAKRFGVGISTAIRWLRRERENGERTARRQGKPRGSRLDGHEAFIVGMIEAQKDITLNEMVAHLKGELSVGIGRSMLSRWLRQREWTFKKRPPMHWSRNAKMS